MGVLLLRRLLTAVAIILVYLCCAATPALAAGKESTGLIRVPVFFITDRNLLSDTPAAGAVFGGQRKYIGVCKHDPFMGKAYCVVENSDNKTLSLGLVDQGWSAAEKGDKVGASRAELIKADDFVRVQEEFYAAVGNRGQKSARHEIILFAHGYKNSLESALRTAARFSYQYEIPVILYSWPSACKLRGYETDENNVEWSQEHYNEVIQRLESLCTDDSQLHTRIFAHSMGCRLVVRATPLLREQPFVNEAAIVCPDIDKGLVEHYARRYLSTKGTATIRLYMSRHDKALAFSQLVHGGYTRMGECADSIAGFVRDTLDFAAEEKHPNDENADEEGNRDFAKVLEATKHRMQTIDFTALDFGAIGHKIPVDLMYNMSYTDRPGPGLHLEPEESGLRSRTSLFFSRISHLKQTDSHLLLGNDPETCFYVMRNNKPAKRTKAMKAAQAHTGG